MGATDVCPLIPIAGITLEETAQFARELAERVGKELDLPVYCYEAAQPDKSRSNLSVIRAGEYEGFFKKIQDPQWKPDFGPAVFDERRGATVIGARDFLVAYNINLNTTSTRRANAVAFDIREAGRNKIENGKTINIPGSLKAVKAIGWYIEEYGIAQISINLTDIRTTPVHVAFDEACKKATERGLRVTGSELVGLVPLKALTDAGRYFLEKQKRSTGVSEKELIKIAVRSLGLDELAPFDPEKRVIEYLLRDKTNKELIYNSLLDFANETASESPAPGGGSVAAYMGVLGASLGTMVANLSSHKKGWDDRWKEFSDWADQGQRLKDELLLLVDADTASFNAIMQAMGLPKGSDEEKLARKTAIQQATKTAMEVPFHVMECALKSMDLLLAMAQQGNPNSVSDAGVGALCARSAVLGAGLNVKINASGYEDAAYVATLLQQVKNMEELASQKEAAILAVVAEKIG
jgi:glutamate formiminotransferase/formiminotetrahydrofolate cyclodeaminase